MSSPSAVWLLGSDYPDLGPIALVSHSCGGALGLSRGRLPKPYAHVDPNEDAALLRHTARGTLLAVADGFNGAVAAELVLDAVHLAAAELVVGDPGAFEGAVAALIARTAAPIRAVAPSDTTLVLMAVLGDRVHVASFGDSAAYRALRREPLLPPTRPGLAALGLGSFAPEAHTTHFEREAGERVAVVSDGVTNYVADPAEIPTWLEGAADDREAVRAILEAALEGGAGDNVAAVTYRGGAR